VNEQQDLHSLERNSQFAIWRAADGTLLSILPSHLEGITGDLSWSPDGVRIAGKGEMSNELAVWRAADGALLSTGSFPSNIVGFTWSPGSTCIALATESTSWEGKGVGYGRVIIWETATNRPVREIRANNGTGDPLILSPAWSPDGAFLAFTDDDTLCLLKTSGSGDPYPLGTNATSAFAWSPDGKFLALAGDPSGVEIWRVADRTKVQIFALDYAADNLQRLGWSADGRYVRAGSRQRQIQSWRVR
jgi:WD40 repeat protein